MRLEYSSPESLAPVLEALLFASDEPLSADDLRALILGEELNRPEEPAEIVAEAGPTLAVSAVNDEPAVAVGPEPKKRKKKQLIELPTIHSAIEILNAAYDESTRSFRIVEIAGGYQFGTRSDFSEYVARLFKEKSRRRLSSASLETLAIVAYKQPVTKADIENIRGVNCDEVLKALLEKNLVTITGRAEAVGRPLLYGTTNDFLRHFGLHSLSDLPRPREIEEMMKEESVRATTLEEAASEFVSPTNEDSITVDEAIAVARELAEREEAASADEEFVGIALDVEAMEIDEVDLAEDLTEVTTEPTDATTAG